MFTTSDTRYEPLATRTLPTTPPAFSSDDIAGLLYLSLPSWFSVLLLRAVSNWSLNFVNPSGTFTSTDISPIGVPE